MVVMRIRNVAVNHRNAIFQHRRKIAQRLRSGRIERIRKAGVTFGILDHIAVEILDRSARRDLRLDIGVAEECAKAVIPTGFVGQEVRPAMSGANRAILGAMYRDAFKIGRSLDRVGFCFGRFG